MATRCKRARRTRAWSWLRLCLAHSSTALKDPDGRAFVLAVSGMDGNSEALSFLCEQNKEQEQVVSLASQK